MTPDTEDRLAEEGLRVRDEMESCIHAIAVKRGFVIEEAAVREMIAYLREVFPAYDPDREQRVRALVAATQAYRDAETDGTPRMWRGKALQDLADALDAALVPFVEGK